MLGFGGAGIGISRLIHSVLVEGGLTPQEAYAHFYALDRDGLLVEGDAAIRPGQAPFARKRDDLAGWTLGAPGRIELLDVVRNAQPTVLIGVSGQLGGFAEAAIREMARTVSRPVIFPLSNPTSCCEATPQQIADWTEGRALIGVGSPFAPVTFNGSLVNVTQTNNSYIFPGLALGIISARARRVSDAMIMASALALAELAPTRRDKTAALLPPLAGLRDISRYVARAVGMQAMREGLSALSEAEFESELAANVWQPEYLPYERIS